MSGSAEGGVNTTKAVVSDNNHDASQSKEAEPVKAPTVLEEDDEFEDFPVEDWSEEDTHVPGGNAHLWEESWDDDDTTEDFSAQLKEELKRMESQKR